MIIYRIDAAPEEVPIVTVIQDMVPSDAESYLAFEAATEAKKPVLFITRKGESVIAFPGSAEEAGPNATYRTLFDQAVLLDDMKTWAKEGHRGATRPLRHFLLRIGVRAMLQGSCTVAVVASDTMEAKELLDRELRKPATRKAVTERAILNNDPHDNECEIVIQDYHRGRIAKQGDSRFAFVVDDDEHIPKDEDS